MLGKRLTPEERRGVLGVTVVALLVLLCGLCHRFGGDRSNTTGDGGGKTSVVTVTDSVPGDRSGGDSVSRSSHRGDRAKRGSVKAGKRGAASGKSRKASPLIPAERDFLEDTIPVVKTYGE